MKSKPIKPKQLHLGGEALATAGAPLFEFAASAPPTNGHAVKPLAQEMKPLLATSAREQFKQCNRCEYSWKNQGGREPIGWCSMQKTRPVPCSRFKEAAPQEQRVELSSFSRAQAIKDGFLVDVSKVAKEAGFIIPVALTRTVWEAYVTVPEGVDGQDEKGRLWDILHMAHLAAKRGGESILFTLKVRMKKGNRKVQLRAVCGPGDDTDPVITILMPDED